jgi:hypothetical protein
MNENAVAGSIVELDSGVYYKIEHTQDMPAFFINLATASDIWMFLSSNGALTAGRQNADGALFPYETDDRLHLAAHTGPKTIVRMEDGRIWEPLNTGDERAYPCETGAAHAAGRPANPPQADERAYPLRRNIYKRLTGDAVMFEEINEPLGLGFSYIWEAGERCGIIRTARLRNLTGLPMQLSILDGVENVMPHGISQGLADSSSCLSDAYKACERPDDGSLAVFSLTSMIVDSPEPMEILRANAVWRIGSMEENSTIYLLSSKQINAFCRGAALTDERRSVGRKGAYLTVNQLTLAPRAEASWLIIMDARLSQRQVVILHKEINETPAETLRQSVEADAAKGTAELVQNVAAADGLQHTADKRAASRHYMNVLYNNMRGGVFLDGYTYDPVLLAEFIRTHDKTLAERSAAFLERMLNAEDHTIPYLHEQARATGDPDLLRLCQEFLPLTFSRRHGDPSRPWNRFHIRVKDDNGNRLYHYEGNWRDIFQNWEAMSLSFPAYIAPMIVKFLNASTVDGFNPYRINENGVDWETPQPNNPFSGYGYWGDHQIVYLNKLLEWLDNYAPEELNQLMADTHFVYANVPYEIKSYADLVKDGKNTLVFNRERHDAIIKHGLEYGTDAKLLMNGDAIYHASFIEKLLIPVLAKLSNFVKGGGIWMNTQRPEWNDANNAIVGNGLSMVTVYQLYRHMSFGKKLVKKAEENAVFSISLEVSKWLGDVDAAINTANEKSPRGLLDQLGAAFEHYRAQVYAKGFGGKTTVGKAALAAFFETALGVLADTIDSAKRADGLYEAYNILRLTPDGLTVSPMFPMLEGQTAVLGSGRLTPKDALALVEVMEHGGLYSPEHKTFYLYPVKQLKTFLERNIIPQETAEASPLIARLLADGNEGLCLRDAEGCVRFHADILQSTDVEKALALLQKDSRYGALAVADAENIREIYESVFAHRQFTGRSGIMYKYEGIGSIYWHQNAKFLLSFQECFTNAAWAGSRTQANDQTQAAEQDENAACLKQLKEAYYRLREGFGFNKEPALWGAFPLEPYSHTPYGMPAQQPGMTGQVKEDILTRYAEIGIAVKEGSLRFNPALLRKSEFLQEPASFNYIAADGESRELPLPAGTLAFTVCQVPVIYRLASENKATVYIKNGGTICEMRYLGVSANLSRSLFTRDGVIDRIEVEFTEDMLV